MNAQEEVALRELKKEVADIKSSLITQDERLIKMEMRNEMLEKTQHDMGKKVTEMHELMLQGRGAKWLLGVLIFAVPIAAYNIVDALKAFFSHVR